MLTNKEKVLKKLQVGIPLDVEPFRIISEQLGIPEEEVLEITSDLKERRIIRRISPIYDTRMLGYDSSLVAFNVDPAMVEYAAGIVSGHPGVSHNYERNNELNLWFTLAVPPDSKLGLDGTVEALADITGAAGHVTFRRKRLFKIGVKLDSCGATLEKEKVERKASIFLPLTEDEIRIIRVTQQDIHISKRPFSTSADELNIDEDTIVDKLKEFESRGVMRRFAAILDHRKAGFSANGMLVSFIPEEIIEEAGSRIASFKAVSHCYERVSKPAWKYNFFSMIHGKSTDEVEAVVAEIVKEAGLREHEILYSSREFKKRRIRYFTEELYNWEAANNHPVSNTGSIST